MKYLGLICARGGSKGVPGKNIKPLAGKPLIAWSIELAKSISRLSDIIVSTDSEDIAAVAIKAGALVPFLRPKELAQDNSPEWHVWRHAIDFMEKNNHEKYNGLVVLPPTAPLRNSVDIEKCLDEFEIGNSDVVITVTDAHRNPYFNMIKADENKFASLVISPIDKIFRRQDAPPIFDITTVAYVARPNFVKEKNGIFEGKVKFVHVPVERSLDIDTLYDFKIADFLMNELGRI